MAPVEILNMNDELDRFCLEHLGAGVATLLFRHRSVGEVSGLRLVDGRGVVVKVHQQRWSAPFLLSVTAGQRAVAAAGVPCPVPLAGPAPFTETLATAETLVPDPGFPRCFGPEQLAVSAGGLAAQVAACRGVDGLDGLAEHPLRLPDDDLWPEPHSPLFDFVATAAGSERIDEVAAEARRIMESDPEPTVAAHTDWAARNVRFDDRHLLAAYDWDSLALVPESRALGTAAITWSATGEAGGPVAPEPEEVAVYVQAYETARGAQLPAASRRAAGGAALYGLAYTARCEHALATTGRAEPHHRRALDALERSVDRLLDLPALL